MTLLYIANLLRYFKRPAAKKCTALMIAVLMLFTVVLAGCIDIAEEMPPSQNGDVQDPVDQDPIDAPDPDIEEPDDEAPLQPDGDSDQDAASDPRLAPDFSVHFIDVGQGDSILIQANGSNILIDAGGRSAGTAVVNYLRAQGVNSLEMVIATHPHEDHIGGLIEVFRQIPVKEVLDPGVAHTTKTFEDYLDLIDGKDIDFTVARAGMKFNIGGAEIDILHPTNVSVRHLNDSSIVARVQFDSHSFLFTGDAEEASEANMLGLKPVTVLKVGHHGSRTSTTQAFMNHTKPKYAVITVGADNRYGHPHTDILNRLKSAGVQTYRSDLHGTIVMRAKGSELTVSTNQSASPDQVFNPGQDDDEEDEEPAPRDDAQGEFVGSLKSDKYHFPDCRHVSSILTENIVWFNSIQEAKSADYTPCGACKPPE